MFMKELKITDEQRHKYSPRLIENFLLYWTEENEKVKQRWQFEKIFNVERRLIRWKLNQESWDRIASQKAVKVNEKPTRESYTHPPEMGLD